MCPVIVCVIAIDCNKMCVCLAIVCYGVQYWKVQTQPVQLTCAPSATCVLTCGAYKMDRVRLACHVSDDSTMQHT